MSQQKTELTELEELIESLYIPVKHIVEQMPKDAQMFIHFKTVGRNKFGNKVDNYTYQDFSTTLCSNPRISDANMPKVLEELENYFNYSHNSLEIFNINCVYNDDCYNQYHYYSPMKNYFEYKFKELKSLIYNTNDINLKIDEIIKLLNDCTHGDKPAYNLAVYLVFLKYLTILNIKFIPNELAEFISFRLFKNNSKLQISLINEMNDKLKKIEEFKVESRKKTEEINNLKDMLKETTKARKFLEQQLMNNEQINDKLSNMMAIQEKMTESKMNNLLSELKSHKVSSIQGAYERIIEKLNSQVTDLKSVIKEKINENKMLKEELTSISKKDISQLLKEELEKSGMTKNIANIIKPHIEQVAYNDNKIIKNDTTTNKVQVFEQPETDITVFHERIGYCKIIGNAHYIKTPQSSLTLIHKIPEGTYLSDGQFVLVNNKNEFKYAYQFYCSENEVNSDMLLVSVQSIDNELIHVRYNEKDYDLNNIPEEKSIKAMQVIAVDNRFNYIRHFSRMYQSADNLLDSIRAKGHTAYFVVGIGENTEYELRNIETDKQIHQQLDVGKFNIKPYSVVIVNIHRVVAYFPTGKFYTLSSYYKDSSFAIVELIDGEVIAKRVGNEERFAVKEAFNNPSVEEGVIIRVDEFNNLIDFINYNDINQKAKNKFTKKYKVTKNNTIQLDNLNEKIMILGNTKLRKAYASAFQKLGIKIELIDGYDSWQRISKIIKSVHLAIITTEFCSHDNMWRLKDEDIPVLYSEHSGANRVVSKVLELLK